jgi:hypothetical protein
MSEPLIAEEKVAGPATWGEMSASERLDMLVAQIEDPEKRAAVRLAVSEHCGPDGPPGDPMAAMNVMLREEWRYTHDGDTSEWDRSAKLSQTMSPVPPSAKDELLARKAWMTQADFYAAYARLQAPQPKVAGLASWSGHVKRPQDRVYLPVRVEWPRGDGTPNVFVAGQKVNAKQRRRWLDLLAQKGVTAERVRDAIERGADRVSMEG